MGRPSLYTQELAAEVCERMGKGETLRQICRDDHMPAESTVRLWATDNRDGFSAQYARAREDLCEFWADEILEIADDGSNDTIKDEYGKERLDGEWLNRSRLRVDARKWLLSKILPKKYGDKLEVGGSDGAPLKIEIVKFDPAAK